MTTADRAVVMPNPSAVTLSKSEESEDKLREKI
jgi:hypothetical protein